MKKQFAILSLVALAMGLWVAPAMAQSSGTVKGMCREADGKPVGDGIVIYANIENGQKYTLKTNKKGEYFSLGITPGKYVVTLYRTVDDQKAGKEADHVTGVQVGVDETNVDLDMKKEMENAAKGAGMSAEELKQKQEQQQKAQKENSTIKTLNEKLTAAKAAVEANPPDYDTAIADLVAANQIDPNRDLIWFKLGDYYRLSANKQTDKAEKDKRLDSAIESYQKAVELKKAAPPEKDPAAGAKTMAAYYNNLAEAYAKENKVDDSVKTYALAAQADPAGAGGYYFNTGAVLTNAGKVDDAIAAFDKVIAADPNKADAYYWKGVNLIGKETTDKDNKVVAPPGTAEAFQKYLELQPSGTYAEAAKGMLASIGATAETSFGTKKKATKK